MSAETTIKQELVAENARPETSISNVKQEAVTPERKRGRKKKSEIVNNTANEEEMPTTRPNRRKRLDYSAFLNDDDDDGNTEAIPQKRKRTPQDNGAPSTATNNQDNRKKRGDATEEMMSKIFSCMNTAPITFDNLIQIPEEDLPPPPQPVVVPSNSGRGRKRKRSGLFGKKHQDDADNCTEETVTCGRCNLLMDGDSWKSHKSNFHNELAWKLGEPPIDLNDRVLVTSILAKVYKARRPLNCENCGLKKKSVLGFLSHKMQCERSAEEIVDMKVKCELCGNMMLPVSLAVHMRLSHASKQQETSDLIVPKAKRKSAAIAQNMIHLVAKDCDEGGESNLKTIHRFITQKSNFLTSLRSKQKLASELEKYGHIKCKFAFCSVLMQNVAEAVKHMVEHYSSKKPDTSFGCRACLSIFHSREMIEEHVVKEHLQNMNNPNDLPFDDSSSGSETEEVVAKTNSRKLTKDPRFLMKAKIARSANVLYPLAYPWTSQFCKTNYNIPKLFQNLLPHTNNWQQLREDLIEIYSPVFSESMDVAFRKTKNFINTNSQNYEWRKIELFETVINDSVATIFCGGPVTEMSWVPTPHDENVEQILSVSVTLDFNKKYHINDLNSDPAVIQFWNFGVLDNQNFLVGGGPQLELCLCGDFGYVTHMEWCPSGCFDFGEGGGDGLQRLGLLAVACTDAFVHVFAVPKPSQLKAKLIKPSPVLKLQIQTETDATLSKTNYIPTKLSWTKAREHRFIAVGYSNGLVALFDLNTSFPLLKPCQDILHPIRTFQPHLHCITALNLYHTSEGCRWLATGSTDRHCKFWDLRDTSTPISVLKKIPVTDGVWLTHWASAIFGYDDDGGGGTPTLIYSVRDFRSEPKNISYSSAAITAVGGTDWLNGVAQGNSMGEVVGVFPHQLMVGLENDRSLVTKKVLLSYGRMVEKILNAADRLKKEQKRKEDVKKEEESSDSEVEEVTPHSNASDRFQEPLDYEGVEAKYGVVFCDTDMTWGDKDDVQKLGYQSKYLLQERSDTYAAVKVTKISFNPNKQAYFYFACGYQSGFVRVASLKSLKERR